MTGAKTDRDAPLSSPGTPSTASADGRRLRSERNRQQIVEAMIELIEAGNPAPSAARVAEEAEVSLRTVFRHFEDMDTLYREIAREMLIRVRPILQRPFLQRSWQGRLRELLDRRIEAYEILMPVKVCSAMRRFQSDYLMHDHRQFLAMEHASIRTHLPEALADDPVRFQSISAAMSFDLWHRLRHDQGLPVETAREVVVDMVERLIER